MADCLRKEMVTMGLVVQKYGGSSVKDAAHLENVASRVVETYDAGNNVVVVVSAQGDTTDDLIEKAREINPSASKREMDMLLSSGEQISVSLLAMAIEKIGRPVISLTGWQAGFRTDSNYSNARIHRIDTERLKKELDKKKIVIVAGFQGVNKYDDITTLGRGGSDTSAVAIAASLGADICEIYTDVDGVYTADPRIAKNAKKLDDISYDEMLELASLGANVLHNRSVEMAKKYNVRLAVKSSLEKVEGTVVKGVNKVEKMLVRGVTRDNDTARISLCNVEDVPGKAFSVFALISKEDIGVDLILQSIGNNGKKDISFTVKESDLDKVIEIYEKNKEIIGAEDIKYTKDVSKVSIVGAGMVNNAGVATKMFEALYNAHINISMIATSEIKISVLVAQKDAERAVNAIHDKFMLD